MSEKENINREPADESREIKDEISSSIESSQPETTNLSTEALAKEDQKQATENMELHAQELHNAPGHGWKHYLLEFLMLFFAVTLGFFAENQREHYVERNRESEYIRSMIEDLKTDTAYFNTEISSRRENRIMTDSLINLLSLKNRNEFEQQRMYYFARYCISRVELVQIHDRTYDQMKSSGNLRLIHQENIADSISNYYFNAKEFQVNLNQTQMRILAAIAMEGKVFDGIIFQQILNKDNFVFKQPPGNPQLITNDPKIINELIVSLHYLISISAFTEVYFKKMNIRAIQLVSFLQKEYSQK